VPAILPAEGMSFSIINTLVSVSADRAACLVAQWASLVCDYVVRIKLGGTNLSYSYFDQIASLSPGSFSDADLAFITPRVLELAYTAEDLKPFYEDITSLSPAYDHRSESHRGKPYDFDIDRRRILMSEIDAYIAKLWGLSRKDLEYILDPASALGADYPSETFRGLRHAEIKEFGEYRTQRLVLEAWDRIVEPLRRGQA
jgi:hypothetical protein